MNRVLRKSAEQVVTHHFPVPVTDYSDEHLQKLVDQLYLGGWQKFLADHAPGQPTPSPTPSKYQLIRQVYDLTGYRVRLGVLDEIEKIVFDLGVISILIRTADTTEYRSEYRIKQTGKRLIVLTSSDPDDEWAPWSIDEIENWDADSGTRLIRGDKYLTVKEAADQQEWERICYRPGTSKTPMDNYFATDSTYAPKMEKHWR